MFLAILIPVDLLLILSFAFVPYITRRTELFGVTIPAEHSRDEKLQYLRASYRNQLLVAGAILVALSIWLGFTFTMDSLPAFVVWLVAAVLYLAFSFIAYLPKHFMMQRIKTDLGWDKVPDNKSVVVIADTSPSSRDTISAFWLLSFLVPLVLTVLAIWFVWPQVPDPVPTHFNVTGIADQFSPKSWRAVAPLIAIQAFLAVVFAIIFPVIRLAKRQIDVDAPQESLERDKRFRKAVSALLVALGVFTEIYIGALCVLTIVSWGDKQLVLGVSLVVYLVVVMAAVVWMMVGIGQGGSRLRAQSDKPRSAINTAVNDDRFWKLGQFYFNPDDPAWVVEKRFGVGWTANFARPMTWLAIGGLAILIVALLIVTVSFGQLSG